MSTQNDYGLPPLGEEVAAHITAFMLRRGYNVDLSKKTGLDLAALVLKIFAGQRVKFPSDPYKQHKTRSRNEEIRRLFDGKNAPVLAHRYKISRSRIWQIVRDLNINDDDED